MCMLATVNTGSARHCASSSLEIVLQIWNICFDPIHRMKANSRNSLNSSISTDITEGRGEREMFCIEEKMRTNKWNEIEFPVGLLCRTNSRVDKLHKHGIKQLGYWEVPDKKDDYRVTVQHVCSSFPLDMISSDGFVSRPEYSSKIRKFWFDWLRILVPKSVVLADLNGPLKQV